MENNSMARLFLALNALFSTLCGIALLVIPADLSAMLLGSTSDALTIVLRLLGAGLILFAVDLIWSATNRHLTRKRVMLFVFADVAWVIASLFIMAVYTHWFTTTGLTVVGEIAAVVGVLALAQGLSAARITEAASRVSVDSVDDWTVAILKRSVNVSTGVAWSVISDHPGYADVAGNLAKVELLSDAGPSMIRQCTDTKGDRWTETCDLYEEGRVYGFRVHTHATDYPYPFSAVSGRWSVRPMPMGCEFEIALRIQPKGAWLFRQLFTALSSRKIRSVLIDLGNGWATRMENVAITDSSGSIESRQLNDAVSA